MPSSHRLLSMGLSPTMELVRTTVFVPPCCPEDHFWQSTLRPESINGRTDGFTNTEVLNSYHEPSTVEDARVV